MASRWLVRHRAPVVLIMAMRCDEKYSNSYESDVVIDAIVVAFRSDA